MSTASAHTHVRALSLCLHSSSPHSPFVDAVLARRTLRGSVDILAPARLGASSLSHGGVPSISSVWMGCQAPPSSCTWANGELDIISTSRALPWRFVHISRRLVLARTIVRASDRSSKDRLLILASNSHHRNPCTKTRRSTQSYEADTLRFLQLDHLCAQNEPSLLLPRLLVSCRSMPPDLLLLNKASAAFRAFSPSIISGSHHTLVLPTPESACHSPRHRSLLLLQPYSVLLEPWLYKTRPTLSSTSLLFPSSPFIHLSTFLA
ncbi:hypothetical protein J3F84DRAFT_34860 [Trichoderma pleuroticola]